MSSEWLNNTRSDTLYEPKLNIQKSLPPVLIEVQATVDERFMLVVLIFCVGKISPNHYLLNLLNIPLLSRIKKFLTDAPDVKKAERLIGRGFTYNASVKRQLSNRSTDSESDLEFPEKLPVGIKHPPTIPQLADGIAFVKRFKTDAIQYFYKSCDLSKKIIFDLHVDN
ncbi:hypothetical protein BY458DRAFT_553567 [Sporodiniella umbellata]|nr:hypothetical protein BY458DRAFT_553567 [Sporodiniella umbellata]